MVLIRVNRNGTFYQEYHVRKSEIEREASRLMESGLTQLPASRQLPSANSFIIASSTRPSLSDRIAHSRVA
jgi:hypothetical protein